MALWLVYNKNAHANNLGISMCFFYPSKQNVIVWINRHIV